MKKNFWILQGWALTWVALSGAYGIQAFAADPESSRYYYAKVPARSLSCDAEAQALASRFSESNPQYPATGVCIGDTVVKVGDASHPYFAVEIEYRASAELVPYTAVFGAGGALDSSPHDFRGAYATLSDCLAALDDQSRIFSEKTGLIAVTATCERATSLSSESAVLKISGWGEPVSRLYATGQGFGSAVPASFWNQILDLVRLEGGSIVRQWDSEVLYYAKDPARLQFHVFHSFREPSQCEAQLAEVKSILTQAGATTIVLGCIPHAPESGLSSVVLRAVNLGPAFFRSDYGYGSPRYGSFEECQRDKSRLLERAASRGRLPLGGVCNSTALASGEFALEIYEQF